MSEFEEKFNQIDEIKLASAIAQVKSLTTLPKPRGLSDDFCNVYSKVRWLVCKSISFIKRIPFIGEKLAKAIELLVMISDRICGINEEC